MSRLVPRTTQCQSSSRERPSMERGRRRTEGGGFRPVAMTKKLGSPATWSHRANMAIDGLLTTSHGPSASNSTVLAATAFRHGPQCAVTSSSRISKVYILACDNSVTDRYVNGPMNRVRHILCHVRGAVLNSSRDFELIEGSSTGEAGRACLTSDAHELVDGCGSTARRRAELVRLLDASTAKAEQRRRRRVSHAKPQRSTTTWI